MSNKLYIINYTKPISTCEALPKFRISMPLHISRHVDDINRATNRTTYHTSAATITTTTSTRHSHKNVINKNSKNNRTRP